MAKEGKKTGCVCVQGFVGLMICLFFFLTQYSRLIEKNNNDFKVVRANIPHHATHIPNYNVVSETVENIFTADAEYGDIDE